MEKNGGIFLMPTIPASTPVSIYQLQLLQTRLSKAVWAASKVPPSSSMDSQVWLKHCNYYFPYPILISRISLPKGFPKQAFMFLSWLWSWHLSDAHQLTDRRKEPFAQPQCSLKEFFSRVSEAALWPIYSHCIFLLYTRTTFQNTCCHTRLEFSLLPVVCWTLNIIKTMQTL